MALLVRGDHELNAVKAQKLPGVANPLRMASNDAIAKATGAEPGFLGPVGFKGRMYADHSVLALADFVCGANKKDAHLTGVNWGRDLPEPTAADIRNVVAGDPSPTGKGTLGDRPRHRGRPHLPARPEVQRGHGRLGARRIRQAGHPVHGLLRHRCDTGRCRGD